MRKGKRGHKGTPVGAPGEEDQRPSEDSALEEAERNICTKDDGQ
jgi:hypothetical protein